MKEVEVLESASGKKVREWNGSDVLKLFESHKEETSKYEVLQHLIKEKVADKEVYELVAPRLQYILYMSAIKSVTKIFEKYQKPEGEKLSKEEGEQLKQDLLSFIKESNTECSRLLALNLGLQFFPKNEEFKFEGVDKWIDALLKFLFSFDFTQNLSLVINVMTEIIYPVRMKYFKSFGVDLFTDDHLKVINGFEQYLNKVADEVVEQRRKSIHEEGKDTK